VEPQCGQCGEHGDEQHAGGLQSDRPADAQPGADRGRQEGAEVGAQGFGLKRPGHRKELP